jgi:hypothetical protein
MDHSSDILLSLLLAVVLGAAWRWRTRAHSQVKVESASKQFRGSTDARTKPRQDTDFAELRDLKDALPPSDCIRVERRRGASQGALVALSVGNAGSAER